MCSFEVSGEYSQRARFDSEPEARLSEAVTPPSGPPSFLFTAFEPSGDDHASLVIRAILRRRPDARIDAWGGPRMEAAGATMHALTTERAAMGLPGPAKIAEHIRLTREIGAWIRANRPTVHVPTDSPAANFPICEHSKAAGCRVAQFVAPQLWAWAPWRIRKVLRLHDLVLCVLPFEESWFRERGANARFVGHPVYSEPPREAVPNSLPDAPHRLALFPGSRAGEITHNWDLMVRTARALQQRIPGLAVAAAPASPSIHRVITPDLDAHGWAHLTGAADDVAEWAHAALATSGTVTLRLARARCPLAIVYRISPISYWLAGRWIVRSHSATLPNLILGRRVVPEFVPYSGGERPLVRAIEPLLTDDGVRQTQQAALDEVARAFDGMDAGENAAKLLLELCDGGHPSA